MLIMLYLTIPWVGWQPPGNANESLGSVSEKYVSNTVALNYLK